MRIVIVVLLFVATLSLIIALVLALRKKKLSFQSREQVYFTITGKSGYLDKDIFKIDLDPTGLVFLNRPSRKSQRGPSSTILKELVTTTNPPNAAICYQQNGKRLCAVVTLSHLVLKDNVATMRFQTRDTLRRGPIQDIVINLDSCPNIQYCCGGNEAAENLGCTCEPMHWELSKFRCARISDANGQICDNAGGSYNNGNACNSPWTTSFENALGAGSRGDGIADDAAEIFDGLAEGF
jgi:hypothetical protein